MFVAQSGLKVRNYLTGSDGVLTLDNNLVVRPGFGVYLGDSSGGFHGLYIVSGGDIRCITLDRGGSYNQIGKIYVDIGGLTILRGTANNLILIGSDNSKLFLGPSSVVSCRGSFCPDISGTWGLGEGGSGNKWKYLWLSDYLILGSAGPGATSYYRGCLSTFQGDRDSLKLVGHLSGNYYWFNIPALPFTTITDNQNTDVDTGTEDVDTIPVSSGNGCVWHYLIKSNDGANLRAGTVTACWKSDGSSVQYTETKTNDIGDTSGVTLAVVYSSNYIRLQATTTSDDWTVKVIRSLM